MECVKKFVRTNKGKIWFSLALHVFVLTLSLMSMTVLYETNDDIAIREFVNGSRSVRDPRLVHQNIILGIIYKVLYHFTIQVPWYEVVQYLVILSAFTAVGYVLLNRLDCRLALVTVTILQIFFAFECYVRPQYTKTAGVATAAGVLLLFWALEKQKLVWWEMLAGIGLACVGFMYRKLESVACLALMLALGVYFLVRLRAKAGNTIKQALKRSLCIFGALAGCLTALFLIDFLSYEIDDTWKSYIEFNKLRTELLDYGFPDYEANREEYARLGINEDAFQLYASWNFNDPDKFNIPILEQLVELKPEKRITTATINSFAKAMPQILKNTYTFWCACILLILWLIFLEGYERGAVLCVISECVIFVIFYFFLFYKGRYGINRVDVGIWYSVSLVFVYLLHSERNIKGRRVSAIFTALLCVFALWAGGKKCLPYLQIYHQGDENQRKVSREILESFGMDKEHLYLIKAGCIPEYNCYGTFDTMPGEILENICWMAGWDCNTPGHLNVLKKFGMTNPYKDLINREDVILIDDNIELTVRYIREYYDKNAEAAFIKTVGNVNLYRIVS